MADKAIIWGQPKFFLQSGLAIISKRVRTWILLRVRLIDRYEELLAYAFNRVGTLITIGSPLENLPLLGAQRIYAAEETWKGEVQRLAADAALVLLHVGSTRGVRWEIEHVVACCDPLRTVLCVNPAGKLTFSERLSWTLRRKRLRNTWMEFREACSAVFPNGLPAEVGEALFIRFDKSWNAMPLVLQRRKIAWFWSGKNPDLSRKTVDSTLLWLTWLLSPESIARGFAQFIINLATFVACILAVIFIVSLLT